MGGKKQAAAPPAPNPVSVATAQTGSNVTTGVANTFMANANEYTPFGNVEYRHSRNEPIYDPSTGTHYTVPRFDRTTTLNPGQQQLFDAQTQLETNLTGLGNQQVQKLGGLLGSPVNTSGLPSAVTSLGTAPTQQSVNVNPSLSRYTGGDFSEDRKRVEQSLFDRLNPQLDRDRASIETKLANQGLVRGSEPFMREMDEYNRQVADQRLAITAQGGQEQQRMFDMQLGRLGFNNDAANQELVNALNRTGFNNQAAQQGWLNQKTAAEFQNTARERALQETLALRTQPINEIGAILGTGQVQMPQFTPFQAGNIDSTPIGQYMYNSAAINSANANARNQQNAASAGGLYGLGSAALGGLFRLSDRAVKHGVKAIGKLANGLTLYRFRYAFDSAWHTGVMADEVEKVMPHAVSYIGPFKAVDYSVIGHA